MMINDTQEKRLQQLKRVKDASISVLCRLADQVGQTPIQAISLLIDGVERRVSLKLEGANPTGSMKDRTAYALVQDLSARNILKEDSVIVESTSGNLGVSLALQCKARGYKFIAVVDQKTTLENIAKMEALGAHLEIISQPDDYGGYLLSRLQRVQELCETHDNYLWTDQYSNPANPLIHYTQTGPEIYRQMGGVVDAIFVPVSTGGTLAGIGRFFREVSPSTRIVGVDAYGSVVFGSPPATRKLTGIGSSRLSSFLDDNVYDEHIIIKDEEAFMFCNMLCAATTIKVGGSSGATLAACGQYLATHPDLQNVVCMCADSGENYASSIFDAEWIQQQGFYLSSEHLGKVQEIRCL
jgi:2,3-diaminopropionate biosynthesis protein SbnA